MKSSFENRMPYWQIRWFSYTPFTFIHIRRLSIISWSIHLSIHNSKIIRKIFFAKHVDKPHQRFETNCSKTFHKVGCHKTGFIKITNKAPSPSGKSITSQIRAAIHEYYVLAKRNHHYRWNTVVFVFFDFSNSHWSQHVSYHLKAFN